MTEKLRVRVREQGWRRTLREIVRALVPMRFDIWQLLLVNSVQCLTSDNWEETQVNMGTVQRLRALRRGQVGLPVEFYRDEIDGIQSCVVGQLDGRLAGIAWSYDRSRPGYFLRMDAGDVELRSVYSLPKFRGRAVAKALIREACRQLAKQGCQRVYAVIHSRNLASRRAFEAIGFRKITSLKRPALFGPRYLADTERIESWREVLAGFISVRRSSRWGRRVEFPETVAGRKHMT